MLEVDLKHFPSKLMKAGSVALIGNGGNLAIAQHMASDITRHTGKFCFAPDSVHTTAVGGDGDWKLSWMQYAKHADLIIGITCRKHSSTSDAVMSMRHQCDTLLFAPEQHEVLDTVIIPARYYHEFETNALWQIYLMMERIGVVLPKLPHIE
jgi:hypothetical protein